LIIQIGLGILLGFVLIATIRYWLPVILGAAGLVILLLIILGYFLFS
jgi:hypothetical protein